MVADLDVVGGIPTFPDWEHLQVEFMGHIFSVKS